ncbi:MAG: aspartate-semialdehyde dehydrogenase [Acidobacteriota bacterium]
MADRKLKVALLGATGMVGQRFVQLLEDHPWFELAALVASDRSAGKPYGEAARWLLPGGVPERAAAMPVRPLAPGGIEADFAFSALDAATASEAEPAFRATGFTVISNASALRLEPEVPLVIPEVNADHLALLAPQRARYGGAVAANPNCSTIGLCLSLEPLRRAFGLRRVLVTTLQALSGAGHPGVASLEALDNVLPEIAGEEAKLREEPAKIFGELERPWIRPAGVTVSAQCNRVPVRDGHLLSVSVELANPASPEEARQAFLAYASPLAGLGLPSAPERPVALEEGFARPQPLLDRDRSGGMAVTVGRLQPCPILGLRYTALVHNTIRGAAGGTLLIAELMKAQGLL